MALVSRRTSADPIRITVRDSQLITDGLPLDEAAVAHSSLKILDRTRRAGRHNADGRHLIAQGQDLPALCTERYQLALMPASRMTFAHLVLSVRRSAADSSGVMPTAVKPSAANFSLMSGSAISLMISR
jgi:hypothetical protein